MNPADLGRIPPDLGMVRGLPCEKGRKLAQIPNHDYSLGITRQIAIPGAV